MIRQLLFYSMLLQIFSFSCFAQDDTEEETTSANSFAKEELVKEQKYLTFKAAYIESIKQKSIENYDKALELLAKCEAIYPENTPMLFEKAKNHFALKQYIEAHHYCDKALEIEPDSFWIMALSRDIYEKEYNYGKAIEIQKNLYSKKKQEAENLLRLYYRTKNKKEGLALVNEIERKNISILNIDFYKKQFNNSTKITAKTPNKNGLAGESNLSNLKTVFSQTKEYKILQKILKIEAAEKQFENLLSNSDKGLALFPAQAKIYLYKGIALNGLGKHKEAASVLESGLDYIFDNTILLKEFYTALITSYSGTNTMSKVNYYKQMVQKL